MASKINPAVVTSYTIAIIKSYGNKLIEDGILQELLTLSTFSDKIALNGMSQDIAKTLSKDTLQIVNILIANKRLSVLPVLCQRLIDELNHTSYSQKLLIIEAGDIADAVNLYNTKLKLKTEFKDLNPIYKLSKKKGILKLTKGQNVYNYSLDNQLKLIKQSILKCL